MIRRVHIKGYKSLSDLEVRLRPLSVIFGPNAAGKSNFLDALQLLSRVVTSRTLKEAFDPPYRGTPLESFTFGEGGIAGHLKKDHLDLTLEVDVSLSDAAVSYVERQISDMRSGDGAESRRGGYVRERLLRYRISMEILPRTGILRISDEYLAPLRSDGEIKTSRSAFIGREGKRLHLRLEGQAHPTYHEVGLDHTLVSRPLYAPHFPHIAAFKQEVSSWSFFYFEPRERMRAANAVKEVRHIGLMGEELAAFLNTLKALDPPQFELIERALHTLVPRITGIVVEPNAVGEVELRLVEDGVEVPARVVSEGTLRMLGLLAVASSKDLPSLIAFEEPENGIHPRRVQLLAEFLKTQTDREGTQFVVTTHSPLLVDLLPAHARFVSRRLRGATEIEPLGDDGPLLLASAIEQGLDDEAPDVPSVSERILRGDFDA